MQQILSLTHKQHGAKDVVTLFHKPSSSASTRVHTLLKQANATATSHATEDQASSHSEHDQAQRTEFQLDVTEEPPTGDQLKNLLQYLGGSGAAGKLVQGARDESDALKRLKENGDAFQRPVVVDWHQGKAGAYGLSRSSVRSLLATC